MYRKSLNFAKQWMWCVDALPNTLGPAEHHMWRLVCWRGASACMWLLQQDDWPWGASKSIFSTEHQPQQSKQQSVWLPTQSRHYKSFTRLLITLSQDQSTQSIDKTTQEQHILVTIQHCWKTFNWLPSSCHSSDWPNCWRVWGGVG